MQYRDKETMIRLGDMAGALHRDVDQLVNNAGGTDKESRRAEFMKRRQQEQADEIESEDIQPGPRS